MIELRKTGYCISCPGIDLEVITFHVGDEKRQNVVCKNEKLCTRLEKMLKEREGRQET